MSLDSSALLDLLLAARDILSFTQGMTLEKLQADELCRSAILYKFAVIGEAVRRISAPFKEAHPQIPWVDMAGMRNRVIHEYHRVDVAEVWRTVQEDIPQLVCDLEPLAPRPAP